MEDRQTERVTRRAVGRWRVRDGVGLKKRYCKLYFGRFLSENFELFIRQPFLSTVRTIALLGDEDDNTDCDNATTGRRRLFLGVKG